MLIVKKLNSTKIIKPLKRILAVFDQTQLPEYLKNQYTDFVRRKKANERKSEKV